MWLFLDLARAQRVRFALGGLLAGAAALSLAVGACSSDDAPAEIDAGTVVDSGPVDSAPADTGPDTGPPVDASTCTPEAPSPLPSTFKPPTALHQKKCSPDQIAMIADCLAGKVAKQTCTDYLATGTNQDCVSCAYTPESGATHGPLVLDSADNVSVNAGGCVASFLLDSTPGGCGARINGALKCPDRACAKCPAPAPDAGGTSERAQCREQSKSSVCAAALASLACVSDAPDAGDGGAVDAGAVDAGTSDGGAIMSAPDCLPGPSETQDEHARRMMTLFCGD